MCSGRILLARLSVVRGGASIALRASVKMTNETLIQKEIDTRFRPHLAY